MQEVSRNKDSKKEKSQVVIGMDISDRRSVIAELDPQSLEIVDRYAVATTPEALRKRFGERGRSLVALEVGKQSPWISRLLESLGHEVLVANARKVRLIHASDRKSDRTDAEKLARLACADPSLLYPIEHRSEEAQIELSMMRARDQLVSSRTGLINHVRGAVKSFGCKLPSCNAHAFAKKVRDDVPVPLRGALYPLLDSIEFITAKIREYEKQIRSRNQQYPECEILQSIEGVGPITALAYRLVIDDPSRFSKSRSVGAYLGLAPGLSQSGDTNTPLRITKAGDRLLRRLLVQSAQYILGVNSSDSDLKRFGQRIVDAGGPRAKRRAVIAVARKLAVLMHRLWTRGELYRPLSTVNAA